MSFGVIFLVSLITATHLTGCDDLTSEIVQASGHGIQVCTYDLTTTNINTVLEDIHGILFPDIHVVVTADMETTQKLLSTADTFDMKSNRMTDFRHHSKWLLLVENVPQSQMYFHVGNLENVAMIQYSQGLLHEAVTLHHHPQTSTFEPLSDCDTTTTSRCYFPNTAYGYNNRSLLVTTLASTPYVYKDLSKGKAVYTGYAIDILREIAKVLNFSYSYVEPPEVSWGLPVNGTYNGIVGMLHRREVDFAASDLTVDEGRARFMEFIYPSIITQFTDVIYRARGPEPRSSLVLLARPFKNVVYLVLFSIAFVLPVLLVLMGRGLQTLGKPGTMDVDTDDVTKPTCSVYHHSVEAGLEVIGALFKQSSTKTPETMSGKILFSSWLMLIVVVTSVYCANLVASLSVHDDASIFSSLEDLADSDYKVGMTTRGISHSILKKNVASTIQQKLWAKIVANGPVALGVSQDEHVARVKNEKYAFVLYRVRADRYLAEDCQLEAIGERITWEQMSFGVPRNSFLKLDLDRIMSQLRESGLLDIWWKKWQKTRNMTKCADNRHLQPITLHQVGGGFILVGVGAAVSVAVLCVELLHHAARRRHGNQNSRAAHRYRS